MNSLEAQLHYPLGDVLPAPSEIIQVATGVYWLRLQLPFALNHINLWLLEDQQRINGVWQRGWCVVDTGIYHQDSIDAWETLFAHPNHLQGLPILRIIVTHCHPDHVGMADWLSSRWGVDVWMSAGEYAFTRMMSAGLKGADGPSMLPHFQAHGLQLNPEKLEERKHYYTRYVPTVPSSYVRIFDGQTLIIDQDDWQVIIGHGHSPEHVSLYSASKQVLISGDMLLPRISTNVSVFAIEPLANPVSLYLNSLEKFLSLPDTTLVLPSHGKPFHGISQRVRQLQEHHAARLAEVELACQEWQSAFSILPIMFPRALDAHQLSFAMGEALAHLHKLWFDGVLERRLDEDKVYRFKVASDSIHTQTNTETNAQSI